MKRLLMILALFAAALPASAEWKMTMKRGGKVVSQSSDPLTAQNDAERDAQRAAAKARWADAPKRSPLSPIAVVLHETELGATLKENSKGKFHPAFRKEFENHPIIKLQSGGGDVEVRSWASFAEKFGVNRSSHKVGKAVFVDYKAEISSPYADKTFTVTESAPVLKNVEGTRSFSDKIKNVIEKEIGPLIPAQRDLAASGTPAEAPKNLKGWAELLKNAKEKKRR